MLFSCHQPEIWFLEKLSPLINASTNMNSSLSKISQYCHNFLKSLISGLRQYLIWSGWAELAAADPRKVGSHLSVGEQVGAVFGSVRVFQLELAIHIFRIRMYRIKYPKNSNEANGCNFGKHRIFGFSMLLILADLMLHTEAINRSSEWIIKWWQLVLGQYGWGVTGWYLVVLGQYNLVLLGIKWYWVSIGLLCLYISNNMEIWLDVTIAGRRTKKER